VLELTSVLTIVDMNLLEPRPRVQEDSQAVRLHASRVETWCVRAGSLPFTTVCAVKRGEAASNPLEPRLLLATWITQPHAAGAEFASYRAKAAPPRFLGPRHPVVHKCVPSGGGFVWPPYGRPAPGWTPLAGRLTFLALELRSYNEDKENGRSTSDICLCARTCGLCVFG
jgi:hypothetical protein